MKTEMRPASSGYGRGSSASGSSQQGEPAAASSRPQQRVSSATRTGSGQTYFDIATTILCGAGDLDELFLNAARDGDYNKLEQMLVQRSDIIVDVDCKDKRTGNTALIWAAKKGHNKILQLLLRHGADPTLRNYEAQTAVEVATGGTKTMLLDSVSRATESSHRLLLQAAWQGNIEVIQRLLATKKLDINCQNAEGLTPLMLVARDVQLFERLAVQLNKHYNPVEVAQELMRARADVHARDNDGRSCLHYAALAKATVAERLVETFIGGGSEPAQLDKRQYTPIHWASQMGNTNVVVALLDGGSEVNSRGFAGLTPLHVSAHNDHQRTAVTLLQHGADVTLTDDRGLTPVDLAKTRKMKTTLKEAWAEATQNNSPLELAPVRTTQSRESGSRLSLREESPTRKKGEVIFDGMLTNTLGAQRSGQPTRTATGRSSLSSTEKARRAERQMIQEIESGRYTPSLLHSRENTRLLGTVRNKPGPPILPHISKGSPSPSGPGRQSPESPPPGRRSSQGGELRRSLEDGRNMLAQRTNARRAPLPARGRLSKTTPISTSEKTAEPGEENSSNNNDRTHRRTGSDPFSTRITDIASTLENIINRRGRSVSTGEAGGIPDFHLLTPAQHVSPLRAPLDRETTMCVNIPTTIPEGNSPGSSTNTITFETDTTHEPRHSTVPSQMMSLPPTSNRILPPTPTFLTQRSYSNLDSALSKSILRDEDSPPSSKEPSPRSDDEIPDNKIRVGLANPMELLRSRSLLKEEFVLAESRPRDPFMASSGSDQTSSSSSISTASSSPRDSGTGRSTHRRSDPSLLTVTLRDKAMRGAGFRKSELFVVQRSEKPPGGGASGSVVGKNSSEAAPGRDRNSPANSSSSAARDEASKVGRSQSLRMTQRPTLQQQGKTPSAASTANLKRSQSSSSVASEAAGKQADGEASDANTSQQQGSVKGAPFSGKGRMVIVRDSFNEFDNVVMASSANFTQNPPPVPPLPCSSSGSTQTSAKVFQGPPHDKPESAYVKESMVSSERGCADRGEQGCTDRRRHDSESRMSVSDVAISGINPLDSGAVKDASASSVPGAAADVPAAEASKQTTQKEPGGKATVSKPPVPNSQSSNSSNKSAGPKTVSSQPSGQTATQAESSAGTGTKPSITSSASSSASSKTPTNSAARVPQAAAQTQQTSSKGKTVAVTSANLNAKKEGIPPSSSAMPSSRSASTVVNAPVSQPPVSKTTPAVSSSSTVVRSGNLSSSLRSASSGEQSPVIRKSASTESLSSQRASWSGGQGKQVSAESGRKQNILGGVQRGLSTSARGVTARLSGGGSGSSRAGSSSSGGSTIRSDGSSTKRPNSARSGVGKVAPSAAKDVAKVVPAASKQQLAQTTPATKPSPPSTTATSAASSKPTSTASASTSGTIAKVMQTLMKGAASPRSSAIRGQQDKKPAAASSSARPPAGVTGSSAGSVVSAKSTPSISTGVVSAKSTPSMSTGVVSTKSTPSMSTGASSVQNSVKPTVVLSSGSSANRPVKAGQGGVSKPAGVSKSVPASPVNTPKPPLTQRPGAAASNAHINQKPSADTRQGLTLGVANSAKSSALMKSPSDSVLDKKSNAGEGKDLSAGGKEPLVKITFGGMNPKPNAIISRYCDPAVLVSTPVIVNPYEHLCAYQTPRDKSPGEAVSASDFGYVVGKPERDAAVRGKPAAVGKGRQGKGAKKGRRPTSSSSRQASAGKRRAAKGGKDGKSGEGDDARPKSGKRVRSGRRRGRKSADKQADKEAEVLAKNASKSDVALISGIGWHVATSCADASDVIAASEIHIDSSDSDISDAESIEDAETLMHQLDISRGTISLTSPRFREIKIQKEAVDARKCIPAVTSDGFPPMNLDMTQREDLTALPVMEHVLTSAGDGDYGYDDPPDDVEDINGDLHKELLLRKLTPIPEMPSFNVPVGSVTEAIARFDRSLKDNQLNDLLEGTPRNDDFPASKLPESSALAEGREKPTSVDSSPKGLVKSNSDRNASKPPRIEVSSVATSSKPGRSAPRRTLSLKEGGPPEKRDKVKKKERKFSETKKEQDEEINDAIEEILSATNTSMSSTLRSTSTLKSASNTLTEGDHQLLLKLKTQSKDSPFHATAQPQDQDDDDDASTLVRENSSNSGEGLTSDTNPSLLKVMHAENFDLGAKVKAMIDAGADEDKIKAMIKADEDIQQLEAKQIVKVMNSFCHMQLHAGGSQNAREPLVRSESHRVSKVAAAALDRVPLVRPSSAGAARTKGRFHELKKSSAGGSAQQLAEKNEGKPGDSVEAHTDFAAAVVDALAGDVAQDVLGGTGASETMCSRLSRRSSRSGSACTHDSQEEETIQWKKGNVLGKGAFGTVWCGLTSEGELIAVKQIELTTTDRRKAEHEYEKVQEEVELLKTLNHTNIVGYLGTSFEDNTVSIFMQFVPGGSIASILARFGALDEAVFRRYTRQILQGVEYLHNNDVIHRDIKGGNVMLMPNGIIKLIDFGCAKRLCINLSLSQSQILRSMKGTPYWMAPEVVNESGHGKKSDIWSIGCTVFEMATMKPPWAEMNPMAAIFAIGSDRTVPKLPSKFSPEAIAFVSKCLTRNQHQRSSASELLKDVFMAERPSKK